MNTKLVNSILQVIESLSEAERRLLYTKLDRKAAWKVSQNRLRHLHQRLRQTNGGDMADLPIADLLHQERQQREHILLNSVSPEPNAP
ncbi:hypothetical protein IQ265_03715 [Nodosilinea sp. LEGE 06152]|uniref:hypothetical protein n=1 Tax=Nodosilinea sp. LEGE 06152 TaxID=2777966 RepID=UPI00187FBD6A|nr:hypothetical protein [Nodosilinea sp. LEGE 06152]MBE9155942.1 hypothetical protein [Nodosilinea sp. LEGE 06152]